MVTRKEEEYKAMAMLLGMGYDSRANTFYRMDIDDEGEFLVEFDADTMEPIDQLEVIERYKGNGKIITGV